MRHITKIFDILSELSKISETNQAVPFGIQEFLGYLLILKITI